MLLRLAYVISRTWTHQRALLTTVWRCSFHVDNGKQKNFNSLAIIRVYQTKDIFSDTAVEIPC